MFDISVWIRGGGPLPPKLKELNIEPWQASQQSDDSWELLVKSPTQLNAAIYGQAIEILRQNCVAIWNTEFVLDLALGTDALRPDEYYFDHYEVIAFHLTGDFSVNCVNPREDCGVWFGSRDSGLLLPGKPVIVDEQPEGVIAFAAENMIFQSNMANYIHRRLPGSRIDVPVICRGKELRHWHRLEAEPSLALLDREFTETLMCFTCNSPILSDVGIRFGRRMVDLTVGFDVTGWGHRAMEHSLFVSQKTGAEINRRFKEGYGLWPVLDCQGPTAAMVRQVMQDLAPLRGPHPRWTIDPTESFGGHQPLD